VFIVSDGCDSLHIHTYAHTYAHTYTHRVTRISSCSSSPTVVTTTFLSQALLVTSLSCDSEVTKNYVHLPQSVSVSWCLCAYRLLLIYLFYSRHFHSNMFDLRHAFNRRCGDLHRVHPQWWGKVSILLRKHSVASDREPLFPYHGVSLLRSIDPPGFHQQSPHTKLSGNGFSYTCNDLLWISTYVPCHTAQ
jgi:hypothetical protein